MSSTDHPQRIPLSMKLQAPDYGSRAIELIERIHNASGPFGLLASLQRATSALGADASVSVHTFPDGDGRADIRILMDCEPRLGYVFSEDGRLQDDPWYRYARDHFEPLLASEIATDGVAGGVGIGRPNQARLANAAFAQFGFKSALIVPTQCGGGTGRFGMLCLGCDQPGELEEQGTHLFQVLAHSLALELHEWWMRETRTQLLSTSRLRSADLRLLALERQGLGSKEIARSMGLSIASIDSKFQRINLKLNCPNRKAAAMRAAVYGLL